MLAAGLGGDAPASSRAAGPSPLLRTHLLTPCLYALAGVTSATPCSTHSTPRVAPTSPITPCPTSLLPASRTHLLTHAPHHLSPPRESHAMRRHPLCTCRGVRLSHTSLSMAKALSTSHPRESHPHHPSLHASASRTLCVVRGRPPSHTHLSMAKALTTSRPRASHPRASRLKASHLLYALAGVSAISPRAPRASPHTLAPRTLPLRLPTSSHHAPKSRTLCVVRG